MAKTIADVMKMVKDEEVKFVDFRFTDTRGKEQHVTVPVSHFDEDKFSSGHAFDGSSIAGWKGIEASDMQLMPDPNTANIDPFFEETTMFLQCDVVEPAAVFSHHREQRRKDEFEGDERQVTNHQVNRIADDRKAQVTHVGAIVDNDALIAAQWPRQLPVSHIDGNHLAGTAPQ